MRARAAQFNKEPPMLLFVKLFRENAATFSYRNCLESDSNYWSFLLKSALARCDAPVKYCICFSLEAKTTERLEIELD